MTTYKDEKINKFIFIKDKINLPTKNIVIEILIAKLFETFPDAIGLFFFDGCSRSDFLSMTSLII